MRLNDKLIHCVKAAEKAERYQEKQSILEKVEVSVLVNEIQTLNATLENKSQEVFDLESQIASLETRISVYENDMETQRQESFTLDQDIMKSQEEVMKLVHEIGNLETRKVEIEEKRKYAMQTGDIEAKAKEVRRALAEAKSMTKDLIVIRN